MDPHFLSVIIPIYNEVANFHSGKLDQVYAFLRAEFKTFELILVDDGSRDGTYGLLRGFAKDKSEVVVKRIRHAGKGPALVRGMLLAKGEARLFTDFDQATPIEEVRKLLPAFDKGYDVVIGSRRMGKAKRYGDPLHRRLMGYGFHYLVQQLVYKGVRDTQCGFKLFSLRAAETLFSSLVVCGQAKREKMPYTGAIDVELLYIASREGFRVKEVPVYWRHVKSDRVNPVRDSLRMFNELVKIRWAGILGKYDGVTSASWSVKTT